MLHSIATTGLTKVYSLACQLGILLLTAHVLGPEGRGVIAAITAWVGVVAVAAHLSLGQVAQPMLAKRKPADWVPDIAGTILTLTASTTLIAWLGIAGYVQLFGWPLPEAIPPTLVIVALALLPFLVAEHHINALAPVAGLLGVFNKLQVVARTLSVVAVALGLLLLNGGVGFALCALLAGQVWIASAGFWLLLKQGKTQPFFAPKTAKKLLHGAGLLHITILGSFIVNQLDILLVSTHLSLSETGQYTLATQLIAALTVFANAGGVVLYSKIAELGADAAWSIQRKLIALFLAITTVGIALSAALTPLLLPLIFGTDFAPAVPVFIGLSFGLISQVLAILLSPQWIARGFFWQTSALTVVSGILSLSLNLWLIPRYGMMGAVYAVLGTQAFSLLINIAFVIWIERHIAQQKTTT